MKKKIIYKIPGLYRDDFRVTGYEFGTGKKSVCIVGTMRGNEVQQLYCCSQLIKKFKQLEADGRIAKGHKILIVPSCNPYSINIQKRFWPIDNTDINRMFPGFDEGETTQRIADGVFKEIMDYEYGIQFTSFYMPGEFMPHIRMMDEGFSTIENAMKFEMPYVVVRNVRPYDTTTLNYNWQIWDTQAFSFYTTSTTTIDRSSAGQSVLSVMKFLSSLGIVKYQFSEKKTPSVVIRDTEMVSVQTAKSGLFEPLVKVGELVREGTPLANIVHPYEGEIMETLYAPMEAKVFFMHTDPLTYANTSVFKLIKE